MTLSRDEFFTRLTGFFEQNLKFKGRADELSADDNLFARGVLESFNIPVLIGYLEELSGGDINLEKASLESFFTINSMYDAFLAK
jgi:acyl carrier protein